MPLGRLVASQRGDPTPVHLHRGDARQVREAAVAEAVKIAAVAPVRVRSLRGQLSSRLPYAAAGPWTIWTQISQTRSAVIMAARRAPVRAQILAPSCRRDIRCRRARRRSSH